MAPRGAVSAAAVAVLASFAVPRFEFPAVPGGDRPAPLVADAPGSALDAALDGRSLLSFLPPEVTGGRFRIVREKWTYQGLPAPLGGGVFWRTPDGNAYTRVEPYDAALVARELEAVAGPRRVVAKDERPSDARPVEREVPLAYEERYTGDEFQFTLEDLMASRLLGAGLLAPRLPPFLLASRPGCGRAIDAHEAAIREAVRALEPEFVPAGRVERWTLPMADLRRALAATAAEAERTCRRRPEESPKPDPVPYAAVERSARGVAFRSSHPDRLVPTVEILVTPGVVGPPPVRPRPASGFTLLNEFLLRTNACGAVPWIYSNFAAGNSFARPDKGSYHGPLPIDELYACAKDVAPQYKDD